MKKLFTLFFIILPIFMIVSCDDNGNSVKPGSTPGSDFRLRSLLEVGTLGGRYQTPREVKSAALIVRFFENGEQVGRGPLISLPIKDGILDCEFLVRGNTGRIFSPNIGTTDVEDFYEKVGKSWTNSGTGNFSDLPTYRDVRVLGFLSSGLDRNGSETAGTPDFQYHIENATHIVALFAAVSENDGEEEHHLRRKLEAMDLGIKLSAQQPTPNKQENHK